LNNLNIAGRVIGGMDATPDENQEVNGSPAQSKETDMTEVNIKPVEQTPEDLYFLEVTSDLDLDQDPQADQWDDSKVNRYLYVIQKMRDEIENATQVGMDQIRTAEEFIARETRKREKTIEFLTQGLHMYAMGQDRKTIETPTGALKLRVRQDKVTIPDQSVVIEWAEHYNNPEILIHKTTVSLAEVKKYIKQTGDIPEGVEVESQEPSFTVVTNK
jgi:phage host-nuclease inhibitor protein Gam